MSLAVEQETDDIVLAETEPVSDGNGMLDDAAKDVIVEAMNSQAEAIDARELKAILEAIDEGISRELGREARAEGTPGTGWVLLDYGDVVVHIFSVALRDYYRIEHLWSKATPVVVVQ